MKSQHKISILIGVTLLILLGMLAFFALNSHEEVSPGDVNMTDAQKFSAEYKNVPEDNKFIYATDQEILDLFDHGSGIVYLGFTECPWCQKFVPLIDKAAKQENLDKIYYFNIRKARSDNDETYQKIIDHLKNYLKKDDEGNPRIYTPDTTALRDGNVVARFQQEPSGPDDKTPDTYWTDGRQDRAVTQLREMIQKTRE